MPYTNKNRTLMKKILKRNPLLTCAEFAQIVNKIRKVIR